MRLVNIYSSSIPVYLLDVGSPRVHVSSIGIQCFLLTIRRVILLYTKAESNPLIIAYIHVSMISQLGELTMRYCHYGCIPQHAGTNGVTSNVDHSPPRHAWPRAAPRKRESAVSN